MSSLSISRLSPVDHPAYLDHLLGLDPAARAARFGADADPATLQAHALRLAGHEAIVIGATSFDRLVGAAEIVPVAAHWSAAIGVSVAQEARDAGIGTRLTLAAIEAARLEGFGELHFDVRGANPAMVRILARLATEASGEAGRRRYVVRLRDDRRAKPRSPGDVWSAAKRIWAGRGVA